jgi:TPR repeat protein
MQLETHRRLARYTAGLLLLVAMSLRAQQDAPQHGALGITFATKATTTLGVPVASVIKAGPADQAGLRPGDIVVGVGGVEVNSRNLQAELQKHAPGASIGVDYLRNGKVAQVTVTLADPAALYSSAAAAGDIQAQFTLGAMYRDGSGVLKDDVQAVHWFRKSAEQGFAPAQLNLGWMYEAGRGVPQDLSEAVHWFQKAADQGRPLAQLHLGWMYEVGRGVPQDLAQAAKLYRLSADQGDANAQTSLGWMYEHGRGMPKDNSQALHLYRMAAGRGNPRAQNNLAILYRDGTGVPLDYAEAVGWFRKAADQGAPDGLANLALMYETGRGVPKDLAEAARLYAEAARLYRIAADKGNGYAMTNLGRMYAAGQGVAKDLSEAARLFRLAADRGNPHGQTNLGFAYQQGQGVAKDQTEAVKWFRLAANQGDVRAQQVLRLLSDHPLAATPGPQAQNATLYGTIYDASNTPAGGVTIVLENSGTSFHRLVSSSADGFYSFSGIPPADGYRVSARRDGRELDARTGVSLHVGDQRIVFPPLKEPVTVAARDSSPSDVLASLRQMADHGSADSQFNLGALYSRGITVPEDHTEAAKWMQKAADQGLSLAQFTLGQMYRDGDGVPRDKVAAYMWFMLAQASGNDVANTALEQMAESMTKAQMADAQRRALEWLAVHQKQGSSSEQASHPQ